MGFHSAIEKNKMIYIWLVFNKIGSLFLNYHKQDKKNYSESTNNFFGLDLCIICNSIDSSSNFNISVFPVNFFLCNILVLMGHVDINISALKIIFF